MKDLVAVFISGLCIVHCLITPIILALGGAGILGNWLEAEWLHYLLLAPILLLVGWSLPASRHQHQQQIPLWLGFTGVGLLLLSMFAPVSFEPWLAISAGMLLITAHLLNRHLLQQHRLNMQNQQE